MAVSGVNGRNIVCPMPRELDTPLAYTNSASFLFHHFSSLSSLLPRLGSISTIPDAAQRLLDVLKAPSVVPGMFSVLRLFSVFFTSLFFLCLAQSCPVLNSSLSLSRSDSRAFFTARYIYHLAPSATE